MNLSPKLEVRRAWKCSFSDTGMERMEMRDLKHLLLPTALGKHSDVLDILSMSSHLTSHTSLISFCKVPLSINGEQNRLCVDLLTCIDHRLQRWKHTVTAFNCQHCQCCDFQTIHTIQIITDLHTYLYRSIYRSI